MAKRQLKPRAYPWELGGIPWGGWLQKTDKLLDKGGQSLWHSFLTLHLLRHLETELSALGMVPYTVSPGMPHAPHPYPIVGSPMF